MIFKVMVRNRSSLLSESEVKKAVKAVDIQLRKHFGPAWNIAATCFLEGKVSREHHAVIEIQSNPQALIEDDAAGYHDYDAVMPKGYVFLSIAKESGDAWTVILSHEMLELVLNKHCNYYAIGRHPLDGRKKCAVWLEACDAVQCQTYEIDGVEVSDFLYPHYFTPFDESNSQNNHCGDRPVDSFGVTEGGYFGYFDFDKKRECTFFADDVSVERHKIKNKAGVTRRKERVSKIISAHKRNLFDKYPLLSISVLQIFLTLILFGIMYAWLFYESMF
jgi:hypothetical protein